jgi:Ca2+-binding RTX toxin-like protein
MLTGGLGNDTFVFTTLQDSSVAAPDLITDFAVGDILDFSAIDANTGARGNQAFHVGGGGGHAGDLLATYDSATDITTVNLYVNNDAIIDDMLLLTGDHHNLNLGDLIA